MKCIEFAIQENMKRILICDTLNFVSNFPSKWRKTCPSEIFRACPKEMASQNVQQKGEFFKNGPFALPSYNLYFLPLMTGQTDLTIVAVVYVLGYWVMGSP